MMLDAGMGRGKWRDHRRHHYPVGYPIILWATLHLLAWQGVAILASEQQLPETS